jgi:hypothetical protein
MSTESPLHYVQIVLLALFFLFVVLGYQELKKEIRTSHQKQLECECVIHTRDIESITELRDACEAELREFQSICYLNTLTDVFQTCKKLGHEREPEW